MNDIAIILSTTLMYSTPLIFTALGGIFSENSGIVNIGLEGMMTIGAFVGATAGYLTGNPWIGLLCAGIAGGIFALIHGIATISFNADHTISGVAINLLAPGVALFTSKILFNGSVTTPTIPMENKIPRPLNGVFESGSILDTLGINVSRVRYTSLIISGILAGIGGASMSLAIVSTFRPALISGQGYIALAAVIFGKWRPQWAGAACLLFGFSTGLTVYLGNPTLGITINENLLSMLPYIVTLIMLVLFVRTSKAPAALGNPYKKGER